MTPAEAVIAFLSSGVTGAGVLKGIEWFVKRHKFQAEAEAVTVRTKVDAATALTDAARELIDDIRRDAMERIELARKDVSMARTEAMEARNEAAAARAEATAARREAMEAVAVLRRRDLAILNPYTTIEQLRDMVNQGPNGWAGASVP